MADFYPLISKAISKLEQNTVAARQGIYERSREALRMHLRNIRPSDREAEIAADQRALEDAIRRVEAEYQSQEQHKIIKAKQASTVKPEPLKASVKKGDTLSNHEPIDAQQAVSSAAPPTKPSLIGSRPDATDQGISVASLRFASQDQTLARMVTTNSDSVEAPQTSSIERAQGQSELSMSSVPETPGGIPAPGLATPVPEITRTSSTETKRVEGVVATYFPFSWYGYIKGPGEGRDYYFEKKAVRGDQHLMRGERVRFEPSQAPRGPRALDVELIGETPWLRGTVKWWDFEKGYGVIESKASEYFALYGDVLGQGERYLTESEPVIFRPSVEDRQGEKKHRARSVTVFTPRHPSMQFAIMRKLQELLPYLAEMAVDESWNFSRPRQEEDQQEAVALPEGEAETKEQNVQAFPVLERYVIYTLNRLVEEKKILISGRAAYANIGLQTKEFYADIIALFTRYSGPGPQEWELKEFVKASSMQIAKLPQRPELAKYITNPSYLILNCEGELAIEAEHIIKDNRPRLEALGIHPRSALREINDAKNVALERVRRNYKIAIPQWRRGQIQLLLPLCLKSDYSNPELALVVNRAGNNYHGPTALTIAQAYMNARLIARPDPEWLRP